MQRYAPATLYINDGEGAFESVAFDPGFTSQVWGVGLGFADYDEDGDLDLYLTTGNTNSADPNRLYRNTTDDRGRALTITLVGLASNANGIGTRVEAYATINGETVHQTRELQTHIARRAQDGLRLHFGFGDATRVDSLVLNWPSGIRQVVHGVETNQHIRIQEKVFSTSDEASFTVLSPLTVAEGFAIRRVFPNPSSGIIQIDVQGAEGTIHMDVFDVRGRLVARRQHIAAVGGESHVQWDAQSMPSGTYVIRLINGTKTHTQSVTIGGRR